MKQLANFHDSKSEQFMKLRTVITTLTICLLAIGPSQWAEACTRLVYETGSGAYMTARGMDWNDPKAPTAIWVYPRGMEQNGGVGKNPITWTSKYGSVLVSFYPANSDGMNEKGFKHVPADRRC